MIKIIRLNIVKILLPISLTIICNFLACPCSAREVGDISKELIRLTESVPPIPPEQRVEGCIKILKDEMASPIDPVFGEGGGLTDSGYVQCVAMGCMGYPINKKEDLPAIRAALKIYLENTPKSDKEMRDRLTIMLGFAYDQEVIPDLINLLTTHPYGFMRLSAVNALQDLADERAMPTLQYVLHNDNFATIHFPGDGENLKKWRVESPIRVRCVEILRKLNQPVEKDAVVVPYIFAIERLKPIFYTKRDSVALEAIDHVALLGTSDACVALTEFITKEKDKKEMSARVEHAKEALEKIKQHK
jgi:hypothetical protein